MSALVTLRRPEGGSIAEITLANPPLNLVTRALLADLNAVVRQLRRDAASDPALRVVVVHQGGARAFCAGSDMTEFDEVAEDPAASKTVLEDHLLRSLAELSVPVIAAIEGAALGGGLELALAADLRVCGRSATLGLPEAAIGGVAGSGSQRLARLVGPARAKQLLFTASALDAATALSWGVVNEVVDDGAALSAARALAARICQQAPLSVRLSKRLVARAADGDLDGGLMAGVAAQETVFASVDLGEGVRAFRERRAPRFVGR